MQDQLTFKDIKNLFNYIDNDKIVIWDLYYKPIKTFFGRILYTDAKAINREFEAGLIITIMNADNQYYQIVTTAFTLHSNDLLKMAFDPMYIVSDLNMTWLNFLIFRQTAMNITKGWFFDTDDHVEVTITHLYSRERQKPWKDSYSDCQTKNTQFPIDTPLTTELNGYIQIATIHSMYTMPDIAMVLRNIENINN